MWLRTPHCCYVLTRSLSKTFETSIDTSSAQSSLTVDHKLKHLEEKESRISNNTEQAHATTRVRTDKYTIPTEVEVKTQTPSDPDHHDSSQVTTCAMRSTGWDCPNIERAKTLLRRDKEQQRQKARTKKEPKPSSKVLRSNPRPGPRPTKKRNHGYAANEDFDSALEASSPISDSDSNQDENDEVCRLSTEEISKATPSLWPADTGAVSCMSDQSSLFSTMIPINARRAKVRGGELVARHIGNAKLQCIDGSSIVLKDVLYVPNIGVNLVSARRLCQAGLKDSFDDSHMKVVTATLTNGPFNHTCF